jgi:hypothetical protein
MLYFKHIAEIELKSRFCQKTPKAQYVAILQVFPSEAVHKPLKSVQKHSLHKAAMHASKHEEAVSQKKHSVVKHHPVTHKSKMPPSSDAPVPAAGTDVVYMHVHQAGYAKGSTPVSHKSAKDNKKVVASKK